jgi:hypothetical protein
MPLRKGNSGFLIFLCVVAVSSDDFAQQAKEVRTTANEFSFRRPAFRFLKERSESQLLIGEIPSRPRHCESG